jgi:hypothetical protein
MRTLALARAGCAALLLVHAPQPGLAQNQQSPPLGLLQQSFPDPFSRRTAIPFEVLPTACRDGQEAVVRIEILNVLVQLVASPTLRDSTGARAILDLELPCGRYLAFWDRTLIEGNRKAAPGSYFYRLYVNDESQAVRLMQVREEIARPAEATP